MADDEFPASWQREEHFPTRSDGARTDSYVDVLHETGDVRLRIAPQPAEQGGGYTLSVTLFPTESFDESWTIRTVSSVGRAESEALSFAKLFDGRYESPRDVEAALEYALQRSRPADAVDAGVAVEDDRQ